MGASGHLALAVGRELEVGAAGLNLQGSVLAFDCSEVKLGTRTFKNLM